MKKIIFLLLLSTKLFAQLPNTDIWLLDIKAEKDTIILSNPVNITNRAGYDNQPSFSPDGNSILYTSIRDEKQSDIYIYNLKNKSTTQFTNTSTTSEYSPNVTPDGKNISVVMVEPDSTQRLWEFPLKGGGPKLVMDKVDSIGYYCWINKDSLALIMITSPPTMEMVNVKTQKTIPYYRPASYSNLPVGRCLQLDKKLGLYYSYGNTGSVFSIGNSQADKRPHVIEERTSFQMTKSETQDYALIRYSFNPDFPCFVYGSNSKLIILDYYQKGDYIFIKDFSSFGIKNISRIAISPDGKKMAIVAE